MFKQTCNKMIDFHSEALRTRHIIRSLGKEYQDHLGEDYHIDNKYFYQHLLSLSPFGRLAHLPKIVMDKLRFRKWKNILDYNKHVAGVHSAFEQAGAGFTRYPGQYI